MMNHLIQHPILIIDNRDSFVFNLVRYLQELRVPVLVREADSLTISDIQELEPSGILLSPGPKRPGDASLCLEVVRRLGEHYPILGVCLGHQVIAEAFGACVAEGDFPVHGKNAEIHHDGTGVFAGLPNPFSATRYHSLVVQDGMGAPSGDGFPACLTVTARTADGVVMGIRHRTLPIEGVQFHPEAEMTEYGHALLANFARQCGLRVSHDLSSVLHFSPSQAWDENTHGQEECMQYMDSMEYMDCMELEKRVPISTAYQRILLDRVTNGDVAARVFHKLATGTGVVFLDSAKRVPEMGTTSLVAWSPWMAVHATSGQTIRVRYDPSGSIHSKKALDMDVLRAVEHEMQQLGAAQRSTSFGFSGGAIGFLGYESWNPENWLPNGQHSARNLSSCDSKDVVPSSNEKKPRISSSGDITIDLHEQTTSTTDAWFWFHRIVMVFYHESGSVELIVKNPSDGNSLNSENKVNPALCELPEDHFVAEAIELLDCAEAELTEELISHAEAESTEELINRTDTVSMTALLERVETESTCMKPFDASSIRFPNGWQEHFHSNFTKPEYLAAVEAMRQYIRTGDIYIANMTQQFTAQTDRTGREIHERLRTRNPSAFSARFPFADGELISASPERLLQVREGWVETRPIKGTRPRGKTAEEDAANLRELEESGKDKAELLMITDLERNDLSRVCEPGSVKVSNLFEVDTLPTVHHLVATVRGHLRQNVSVIDCLRACFPGGSITGAPKIRAMEVIRELEGCARGPYTGALGWLDVNGNADFSILIRTLVKKGNSVTFGVGGGITWESNPEEEYAETLDKAKALMEAVGPHSV